MGFGDRHALTARPGRDGQRRAWGLWRQSIGGPTEWWFPQEAHTNVSECMAGEAVQNRAEERIRDQTPPAEKRMKPAFSYVCLPDTVNPRGPRGK
jgi:hypothetical protein